MIDNRRQIKCNNERPVCVNCRTYDRDCVYEPVDDVAKEAGRERHHRFKRRKNPGDNARDESRRHASPVLSQQGDTPSSPREEGYVPNSRDDDVDRDQSWGSAAPSRVSEASVARILVSANGVSSYHGRTSALFEDNVQDRPVGADNHPRMSDEWVERGLVAEAARQRKYFALMKHRKTYPL